MSKTMQDVADALVEGFDGEKAEQELSIVARLAAQGHPDTGAPYKGEALSEVIVSDEFFAAVASPDKIAEMRRRDELANQLAEHMDVPFMLLDQMLDQINCLVHHPDCGVQVIEVSDDDQENQG